jgi:hypothetical protein
MISNKRPRNRSPPTSPRDAKRPRLDATRRPQSPCRFGAGNRSMGEDEGHPQDYLNQDDLNHYGQFAHTPGRTVYPQWPTSSGALSPDPNVPGPSGYYPQGSDYFSVARTTSVPVPKATLKPASPGRAESSSSESSSLSTPFTSISPVASFSSDTSAGTHYSFTTSISEDHSYAVFTSQLAQRPGGATGPGFQLRLTPPETWDLPSQAQVTKSGESSRGRTDESAAPGNEGPHLRHSRSLETSGAASYDASHPPFLRGQAPGPDRAEIPPSSYSHRPTADPHTGPDPNLHAITAPSQQSLVEPILPTRSLILPGPSSHDASHLHAPPVFSPSQGLPLPIFPANPLASTLARDALLMYAHRIYESPASPLPSGLSAVPLSPPATDPASPDHAYRTQLLPLLMNLRNLHPRHLPTLLLFSCVLYAIGDLNGSLALNSEILHVDPNYVSQSA